MIDKRADAFPVKYVLYAHYGRQEKADLDQWNDGKGTDVRDLPGIGFLISRLRALRDLLTAPRFEGLAVLFYAPGLPEFFDGIAEGEKREELLRECTRLRFAEAVSSYIDKTLALDDQMRRRIRFVTALDLYGIFARVKDVEADNLRWWFIGQSEGIHYDTPKIVEAFVRLRLLGNGIPVFRLDWDVLFSSEEKTVSDLGLSDAVKKCLQAYRLRLKDPSVATFLFSASYDSGRLSTSPPSKRFEDWRGAFATRVFPALPIVQEWVDRTRAELNESDRTTTLGPSPWEKYAVYTFSEPLARRFYGFSPNSLSYDDVNGIVRIGAHPLVSVISGAFFCFSDGAILDLPPFSNFSINVSWIDDHLKYCLHRELRHLTSDDLELSDPELSDAKIDKVMLTKARGRIDDLPKYVLSDYLPTLLWGTVLDCWITPDPLLKFRPENLSDDQRDRWGKIPRRGTSEAVLPEFLQRAAVTGKFPFGERYKLKKLLIKQALERINGVRRLWAKLIDEQGQETFASIWAKASVDDYFPDLKGRAEGIAPGTPLAERIDDPSQLNRALRGDFDQVIEDTLQYVDWTIHWPGIVRIVRSIEQGTIRTDLGWPLL